MSTVDANIGRVLGSYRLVRLIAEGGMSLIYLGAHTRLKRSAAIKLLKPALQRKPEAVARFLEEARTLHQVQHPNIVESVDLVEDADAAFCVLELLEGPTLEARLAEGGRIPLASAVHIGAQIADALHAVHGHGIVHRDLKPQNVILIERAGRHDFVKLIDFGVAQLGPDDARTPGTFGTAAYMAPEQAAGARVDVRADIYALGVILFEMATGQHPFASASDSEYTLRHADEIPATPSKLDPAIPRELDAIIHRCLEKRPAARYPNAAAVASALRALDVTALPRRRARVPLVIAGIAAVAAAVAVVAVARRDKLSVSAPAPVVVVEAPRPEPSQPAPPPRTVTLAFQSSPPGARVYRPGETVALGTTPFQMTLRAGTSTRVRFELPGYAPVETDASLAADSTVEVTLDKEARPQAKKPPPKKLPLQREGVIDPFTP